MRCAACGTELQDGLPSDLVAKGWLEVHTRERCLEAQLAEARLERNALADDRRRALKLADSLTLDTQTCEGAVALLRSLTLIARAQRDEHESALRATSAKLAKAREALRLIAIEHDGDYTAGHAVRRREIAREVLPHLSLDPPEAAEKRENGK